MGTSSWGGVLVFDDGVMIERSSNDDDDDNEASELGINNRNQWDKGKELWQRVE